MNNCLVWRDSWRLNILQLDADHVEMVRLINQLANRDSVIPLRQRLNVLVNHIHTHCKREEAFLESIEYPEAAQHASEHAVQLAEFTELQRELEASDEPILTNFVLTEIKAWFLNHVVSEDQEFAAYYHQIFVPLKQKSKHIENLKVARA